MTAKTLHSLETASGSRFQKAVVAKRAYQAKKAKKLLVSMLDGLILGDILPARNCSIEDVFSELFLDAKLNH